LLVENYSNSRQVWTSSSYLQFLCGLRPNKKMYIRGKDFAQHSPARCNCIKLLGWLDSPRFAVHMRKMDNKFSIFPFFFCYPKGCATPSFVRCQGNTWRPLEQAQGDTSPEKINVTSKFPVGNISVVTLIRTDTTLDHSQKAEKVCFYIYKGKHVEDLTKYRVSCNQHGLGSHQNPWHSSMHRGLQAILTLWFSRLGTQAAITAFTSWRTNLSPFTKGCREWDASMWLPEFLRTFQGPTKSVAQSLSSRINQNMLHCIS